MPAAPFACALPVSVFGGDGVLGPVDFDDALCGTRGFCWIEPESSGCETGGAGRRATIWGAESCPLGAADPGRLLPVLVGADLCRGGLVRPTSGSQEPLGPGSVWGENPARDIRAVEIHVFWLRWDDACLFRQMAPVRTLSEDLP